MRRRILNVTAAISLALLALVLAAFFSSPALTKHSTWRAREIKVYRGQVEIFRYDYPPRDDIRPAIGNGYQFRWDGGVVPGSKAIVGFDAGYLPPNRFTGPPGTTVYYIAFPIWPLAVPFLIAPTWWFWKWKRKRREGRMDSSTAFPVGFEQ